jgi:branched-chain amino acid transport system substrate-binding protein
MLKWRLARSRRVFSSMVGLIIVLIGMSACAQGQSPGPTFADSHPITIGVSLPLTKDFASDGQATGQGYQLWADMVNNAGGLLGRPVKLIILDDKSDPDQTAKDYQTLIAQDHVDLVFGPFSSLLTKAAAPVVQRYGYAFLEGSGGAPSVFTHGWSNLFDVSLPVANNLITFAYYTLSLPPDQRPRTAAYLTSDDPFTFPQLDLAQKLLENAGIQTVYPAKKGASDQFPDGDLKAEAQDADQLALTHADVVLLGTVSIPDTRTVFQEFKKAHYNPKALIATAGPDQGQDFVSAIGGMKYTEGVFVPNGWYPQANNFQNAEMVKAYLAKYGGTANQINADVAEAFSVGQVLQQAVAATNSINNAQLVAKLQSGIVFNTVQGTAQFDSPLAADAGQNRQAIAYLFQWQNGQLLPVYPYSVAAQNPEYPRAKNF